MNEKEAMQLALGYSWGHEDASGIVTLNGTDQYTATYAFACAYTQGWDDYDRSMRGSMIPVGDAYETWQSSGGTSVFKPGDSTAEHQERNAWWRADARRRLTGEITSAAYLAGGTPVLLSDDATEDELTELAAEQRDIADASR